MTLLTRMRDSRIIFLIVGLLVAAFLTALAPEAEATATTNATAVAPKIVAPKKVLKSLADGTTVETYQYGGLNPDNTGDVYYDKDWAPKTRAAIIVIHGGWWHNSDRKGEAVMAQQWRDAGFVVFNIDYRLGADQLNPDGTFRTGWRWPAQRNDVYGALVWLRANADQFGVDPARIGLYGSSAGGHMAMVAAGEYGKGFIRAIAAQGAVMQPDRAMYITMQQGYQGDAPTGTIAKTFGYITSLLGCSAEPTWGGPAFVFGSCGGKWKSFRPDQKFGADKPAMYLIKGENDPVEPKSALTSIEYWLDYHGQDHVTVLVPGRGHEETMVTGSAADEVARRNAMISWMRSKTA